MLTNRRHVLGGLVTVGAGVGGASNAGTDTDLSFLVIGDWGRDGASHQRDVADQMEIAARAANARFVVAVGDNFYEDGVQSVTDPKWRTSFEDVYTGDHLRQMPWYVALGNHDYGGVPQAQVDYTAHSARWHMPARYFKVAIPEASVDLFIIDTTPIVEENRRGDRPMALNVASQDVPAQLQWLDRELAASQARVKFVFGHHTLFSGGSTHGDTPDLIKRLLPILQAHRVTAYVNGHDHDLQHIVRDGVDCVCTGAGSAVRPVSRVDGTRFCVARSGFSVISVRGGQAQVAFHDYTGASLYRGQLAST